MNITLYGGIEHGGVGGIIDRLAVVVMHSRLPPIICDEMTIVDGAVGGLSSTWTGNTPGTGIVTTDSGGPTIEHH